MPHDDTYISRWMAGIDAACEALTAQSLSMKPNAPILQDAPCGMPLIRVDGIVDIGSIVAAVLKASDKAEGRYAHGNHPM